MDYILMLVFDRVSSSGALAASKPRPIGRKMIEALGSHILLIFYFRFFICNLMMYYNNF